MKLRIPLAAALAATALAAVAPAPASARDVSVPNPCTKEPATPSCQEYVATTAVELVESADAIVSALRSDVFIHLRAVEDTVDEVVNEEVWETLFERNDCSDQRCSSSGPQASVAVRSPLAPVMKPVSAR